MTQRLFDMATQGDGKVFSQAIKDSNIKVFRRKRLPIVKLTPSFTINNYSYFTPLLVAIQNKHLVIVTFIMEKMKISLR